MSDAGSVSGNRIALETTFVLFFLSVDFGQNVLRASFDTAFLGVTVVLLAVLPFFLYTNGSISISAWLTRRFAIVFSGLIAGMGFERIVGSMVPGIFGHLPLVLAIASGCVACWLMYASLFRFRFAE